ncbi:Solid-state culture expressed protein (Aos23) [Penicillium frequentans]|uniref:Solid-state culture expressed protein (Aos23) n=1 Tax=Penicillium frequentans TaxID=3151616 RepID=A0AAD6CZY6_9EURO|nr:Solid-state culture expressed protein (Aos23) [Penicillium glabrum]
MDTINQYVSAASTALWGENAESKNENVAHGDEPISGVQGKGMASDPYDAGNRDEQPDAPKSDVNTVAQEPELGGIPLMKADPSVGDTTFGAVSVPGASGSGPSDSSIPKLAETQAAEQRSTNENAVPKIQELGTQDQDTAESKTVESKTAESKLAEKNITENKTAESNMAEDKVDTAKINEAEKNDELPAPPHNKDASEEALKGPQGPAPKPAEQFEKEEKNKQKKPAESRSSGDSDPSSKSSDKASNGSGDKKHGAMAKVKETLNKVAHPRHGNNKE